MIRYPLRVLIPAGAIDHLARPAGPNTVMLACGETRTDTTPAPAGNNRLCANCARRAGKGKPGPAGYDRYETAEAKLTALTRPTADGHLEWTGPRSGKSPLLKHNGQRWRVFEVAFRARWGRDPVGPVKTACDHPGCLLGDHLDDNVTRAAHRAAYAALGL